MYKVLVAGAAGLAVVGLVANYALARPLSKVVGTEEYKVKSASEDQLDEVAGLRIFFGHQSVGGNLIRALPTVYADAGMAAPEAIESEEAPTAPGPVFLHSHIGKNRYPLGKIDEFDHVIRSGMGDAVDVAVFKLCYVDFHDGDDVAAVFEKYRDTMAALERDYPDVTFLYMTVPLTIEPSGRVDRAKTRVKDIIGRDASYRPEHNVAREEFNAMIRAEYGTTGRLFDIAAVQSTSRDGTRTLRSHDGSTFFVMEPFLASDPGHLNPDGAAIVASAFLATMADAVG